MHQEQLAIARTQPIAIGPGQPLAPPPVTACLPFGRFGEAQSRLRERRVGIQCGIETPSRSIPAALSECSLTIEISS